MIKTKTMQEINKIKSNEQSKALRSWSNKGFKGSIIAGTGFGKSRCGVLAINHILKNPEAKAMILVPTVQLQEQFKDEFHKWGYDNCLNRVDILCYQSAHKLLGEHYDIVVCDEIHLGLSVEYRKFFKKNTYDRLLCMTATLPEEEEYKDILKVLAPTVYTLTLDQCVELGLVAPYEITCVPISLTPKELKEYKTINNNFVRWKYALGQYDAFNNARVIMGNANAHPEDKQAAAMFYKAIRERKAVVDSAYNKITKVKEIVKTNKTKRILVFSGANAFTDKLCDAVKPLAMSYHSKKTKKQKEEALQKFRDKDINILCSTKALNQGLDIPSANMGIICGLTSKSLTMIQRIGRLLRFEAGKKGQVFILYVKNSQEEKWLKNSVKGLNNIKWI